MSGTIEVDIRPDLEVRSSDGKVFKVWGKTGAYFRMISERWIIFNGQRRPFYAVALDIQARRSLRDDFARDVQAVLAGHSSVSFRSDSKEFADALVARAAGRDYDRVETKLQFKEAGPLAGRISVSGRTVVPAKPVQIGKDFRRLFLGVPINRFYRPPEFDAHWRWGIVVRSTTANQVLVVLFPMTSERRDKVFSAVEVVTPGSFQVSAGTIVWVRPDDPGRHAEQWSIKGTVMVVSE